MLHQYTVYRQGQKTMTSRVELGSSLLQVNPGPVADLLFRHVVHLPFVKQAYYLKHLKRCWMKFAYD